MNAGNSPYASHLTRSKRPEVAWLRGFFMCADTYDSGTWRSNAPNRNNFSGTRFLRSRIKFFCVAAIGYVTTIACGETRQIRRPSLSEQ